MSIKSIFLGLLVEEAEMPLSAARFAMDFAGRKDAHLRVGLGSPKFEATTGFLMSEVQGMLKEVNARRLNRGKRFEDDVRAMAVASGVALTSETVHEPYYDVRDRIVRMGRVSDIAILTRTDEITPSEQDFAEDMLFNAGRPLMMLPPDVDQPGPFARIVVAWDGGARAARAVGDAMPLLGQATSIELVSVSGDPDKSKRIDSVEIAQHLSRHCNAVSVTELPPLDGSIGAALRNHMSLTRADLLVMGGFAHSRLRQSVLGGVTNEMLSGAPFPLLMSY